MTISWRLPDEKLAWLCVGNGEQQRKSGSGIGWLRVMDTGRAHAFVRRSTKPGGGTAG